MRMNRTPAALRLSAALGLAAALSLAATGCKSHQSHEPQVAATDARPPQTPHVPLDPATLGDVTGVVRFAGKAPAAVKIDTSMDPACGMGGTGDVYTEQYVIKGDRVANVYVYVKSGPPAAMQGGPARTEPVVLDQKGCVYVPHVIAAEVGEPVEFRNSDPTMHNIHTMPEESANPGLDISQGPKGKPQIRTFAKPEQMMPVRCNNHPWMNAFINISATPWFAVTGPDGKFEIKGLPAGDYTLGAVQEKMGEQEIKVTVKPKTSSQADFTFALKPATTAAPAT
jgi:plastocyanin